MHYSTILFDLDGTLTDPKIGITKSVQYALAKFDVLVEDLDELEPFIGPPLIHSFVQFYSFSEEEAQKAVHYYREYFKRQGMYENMLYSGIIDLLQLLTSQQRLVMIATSKPTVFAEKIATYFNISTYFDSICGSHLDGRMSDKAELINYIIDTKQVNIQQAVMIGDRKYDIIGAQRNGMDSIAVGYGYGNEEELRGAKPTHYLETVQELIQFFS